MELKEASCVTKAQLTAGLVQPITERTVPKLPVAGRVASPKSTPSFFRVHCMLVHTLNIHIFVRAIQKVFQCFFPSIHFSFASFGSSDLAFHVVFIFTTKFYSTPFSL